MTPMNELTMLVDHAASARKALKRNQDAALAGALDGLRLKEAQCDLGCPQCMMRCAAITFAVADIEKQIDQLGGMTINGISYAFAGRA